MEREQRISQELIKQARQTDLAEYLISQGEPLIRAGERYRHGDDKKLVFTKSSYYWNGRGEKGNAVDFLMRHRGLDFMSAVIALTMTIASQPTQSRGEVEPIPQERFSFAEIKLELDMRRTIAYLNRGRGIGYHFIRQLITDKLIYQEATTNNIIFTMYDEVGEVVGAELCGTLSEKRFKGIKTGSKYGYGYSIKGRAEKLDYALFFESAVDLLSFVEVERLKGKPTDNALLVSMAGLKDVVIKHTLNRLKEPLQAVLCVDNDEAGAEFINNIKEQLKGVKTFQPEPQFKDWNDQLRAMKNLS